MGALISKIIEICTKPSNNSETDILSISTMASHDSIIDSEEEDFTFGADVSLDSEEISSQEESIEDMSEEEETIEIIYTFTNEKKALLIGINYSDDNYVEDDLNGCVNDMNNLKDFLTKRCHFLDEDIKTLCNGEASNKNIKDEIEDLVVFSYENPGSEIWLSYSGHGSSITSFTEEDFKSEVICPSDYAINGMITDEWIQEHFVKALEKTTKVFVLMDCCNSGSNLNLPYRFKSGETIVQDSSYTQEELSNLCNIIKISGCEDDQTSADYFERTENEFQGALTNGFLYFSEKINSNHNNVTFFYNNVLSYLTYRGFTQRPVLSFTKPELLESKLFKC
jgi:hypothetical protein